MKIVVHDASILIDLAICDAVEAWFATEVETWTSELIFPREIEDPAQRRRLEAYAGSGKLRVHQATEPAESLVEERDRLHRGLSLADTSVLLLTRKLGHDAVLATGDALLRRMAEAEKIKACGILGLFDVMVKPPTGQAAVLPAAVAAAKLQSLLLHPECRLPREICQAKIKGWLGRA